MLISTISSLDSLSEVCSLVFSLNYQASYRKILWITWFTFYNTYFNFLCHWFLFLNWFLKTPWFSEVIHSWVLGILCPSIRATAVLFPSTMSPGSLPSLIVDSYLKWLLLFYFSDPDFLFLSFLPYNSLIAVLQGKVFPSYRCSQFIFYYNRIFTQ